MSPAQPAEQEDQRRAHRLWPAFVAVTAFALLPMANFLAANIGRTVDLAPVARYGAVALTFGLVLVLAGAWVEGAATAGRIAVLLSTLLLLFFNYPGVAAAQSSIGVEAHWHPLGWVAATTAAVGMAAWAGKHAAIQTYAALVGVGLLLAPSVSLGVASLRGPATIDDGPGPMPSRGDGAWNPDVWFFSPDAYAGADVVAEVAGADISGFTDGLADRGFVVSSGARANYPTTFASLSSTLEMRYLLDSGDVPPVGDLTRRLRGDSEVVRTLRERGYAYIHAMSGVWAGTSCEGTEDHCIGEDGGWNETEAAILRSTPLEHLLDLSNQPAVDVLLRTSDPHQIARHALTLSEERPRFLFAHLLTPHPPFIRHGDCTPRTGVEITISEWPDDHRDRYRDSVACLNRQLLDAIDLVLERDPDAVIVIQADHGTAFPDFTWELPGPEWAASAGRQRLSILSAVRLPERCDALEVPDDLTPVNTFRLVMACLDDSEPQLLPNRSFLVRYGGEPVEELDLDPASQ